MVKWSFSLARSISSDEYEVNATVSVSFTVSAVFQDDYAVLASLPFVLDISTEKEDGQLLG